MTAGIRRCSKACSARKWIKDKNLMITGRPAGRKTYLACALAQAACRDGVTVLYKRTTRLFDELGVGPR